MQLDSFTVGYSIQEDRLLLQANGKTETQSFWITRRAATMIAEGVRKALVEQYQRFGKADLPAQYLSDVMDFDYAAATEKNPPKPGAIAPVPLSSPILLYQISYSAESAEHCIIHLTDADGRGHGYRLTAEMLHALMNLIQSQCDQAGWEVQLLTPTFALTQRSADRALH